MRLSIRSTPATLLCTLSLVAIFTATLSAQEKIRSDQRLPAGVLVYGSTPDIPTTAEAFRNTSYGQLISGPELEEFRQQVVEVFQQKAADSLEQVEDQLGLPLSDLPAVLAGDASIAIVRPIGQPLGAVLFIEYGEHRDIIDQLLTIAEEGIADQGGPEKQSEEYAGTPIHFYSIETPHPDYPVMDVSFLLKDGQLVIASSRTLLEGILDRWDGQNPDSFAKDEFYSAILKQCATTDGSTPDSIWFINPIGLMTAGLGLVPQAKPFVNLIPLYLPTVGLNKLKASGATMEVDAGEFNILSKSMLYVNRPASGILKMFELRPTLDKIAPWVPANASQYMAMDWNLPGAYEAVESIYDGFLGPGSFDRQVTELSRQANQDNLQIKQDLVNVLSGRMEGYMFQVIDEEQVQVRLGAAIDVTDEDKGWKLVNAALKSLGEFKEHDLNGTRAISAMTPGDNDVCVCIKNKQILISSGMDELQKMLAGESVGPALADSAEYKRAQAHIPEKVSLLSYQSSASQLRDVYEKLRLGQLDAAIEGEFDFSVLPPFEKIEKYLVPSFGYFVPVEKGAYSVQFGLKPAE